MHIKRQFSRSNLPSLSILLGDIIARKHKKPAMSLNTIAVNISPVKRERLKKLAARKRKEDMRASLPVLTKEEIRRYSKSVIICKDRCHLLNIDY